MCARGLSYRGILAAAILLAAAASLRAEERKAPITVSVNVVRSCVVGASDGAVTVQCGRGAASVVALSTSQQQPVITTASEDGKLRANTQMDPQTRVVTVIF